MLDCFDGGIIDASEVLLIINKLKLYIENEEKIIKNIKNTLSLLDDYYSGHNKTINNKKNNLYNALNETIENNVKIVNYLDFIVNNYLNMDNEFMQRFQTDIN